MDPSGDRVGVSSRRVRCRPKSVIALLAALLTVIAVAAACGSDDGADPDQAAAPQPDGAADESDDAADPDQTAPEPDGSADEGDDGAGAGGEVCDGVTQADLDAIAPGFEWQDPTALALAEEVCEWSAPSGEGEWFLQVQVYEGGQFYGEEEFADEATPISGLCDRAFSFDLMGASIQFRGGDTVVQVSLSRIFIAAEDDLSDEELDSRLKAFAASIAARVC